VWSIQSVSCSASDTNSTLGPAELAAASFAQAHNRYAAEPTNTAAAWQFARACFDVADVATNDVERAALASQGIRACKAALARDSNSAPVHYYLGMNLAQLAQTKGLGALKLVGQMRREFSVVLDLDEPFDNGGADRNLGLLYRDAPALISIGDRSKAQHHLARAVELAPELPENRLNLIEAYLKWGDRDAARRQLEALQNVWPAARTNFTGTAWISSWADWQKRLDIVKKKLQEPGKSLESPRAK